LKDWTLNDWNEQQVIARHRKGISEIVEGEEDGKSENGLISTEITPKSEEEGLEWTRTILKQKQAETRILRARDGLSRTKRLFTLGIGTRIVAKAISKMGARLHRLS
jgi:hypothetical protein